MLAQEYSKKGPYPPLSIDPINFIYFKNLNLPGFTGIFNKIYKIDKIYYKFYKF